LRRIAKDFRPDVVFAPYISSNGLIASLAWGGPLVVSGMGSDVLIGTKGARVTAFLRRQIVQYVCRRADAVHVVSDNIERTLLEFGVPADKIHQFPLGIDTARFYPDDRRAGEGPLRIICVRKHEPIYDIATILRSLARLTASGVEYRCTFIGGGSLLEQHRRLAAELRLSDRVEIVGNVPYDELPDYLRAAEIYVSAARSDGASSSLLEAMASGLLPVVADIDANAPWIRHGTTGFLFPPGNSVALAETLERAAKELRSFRLAIATNRERVLRDGNQRTNDRRMAELLEGAAGRSRSAAEPCRKQE
jgi:glycosyltransferase involved in cell wall biosynthesis